jgi:hypothetical protein
MSLKFDHSQNTLSASMGMSEGQTEELAEKMTAITKDFIKSKGKLTKSEIAEKIALELSYSELVFIATGKIFETLDRALERQEEMLQGLESLIKMMKDGGFNVEMKDENDE